jgi:tRNA-2-methylthio-N6-dimethylallyladenosine synthase
VERIRAARPDLALSGDFIVGFPGETAADFETTLALVREVNYASAFSFKYSRRPGTPGAAMPSQIAEAEKDERLQRLQALLAEQQAGFNGASIGRTLSVLFERPGRHPGQLVGRSPYLQAVHATAPASALGAILPVVIAAAQPNSLSGVLVGAPIPEPA